MIDRPLLFIVTRTNFSRTLSFTHHSHVIAIHLWVTVFTDMLADTRWPLQPKSLNESLSTNRNWFFGEKWIYVDALFVTWKIQFGWIDWNFPWIIFFVELSMACSAFHDVWCLLNEIISLNSNNDRLCSNWLGNERRQHALGKSHVYIQQVNKLQHNIH